MASDTDQTTQPTLSDSDRKARMILARALWNMDTDTTAYPDQDARKAAFQEVRQTYLAKARRLAKTLEKRGMDLHLTAES